jgi:Flp pilus assembly protein TadD
MADKARFRWTTCARLVPLVLSLAACGAPEPAKDPPLTADPPASAAGNAADDGAVQTEIERGEAYIKNEKFAEAKVHFEKALAIKPSAGAWTYLGVCAEKASDRPGAEKAYRSALGIDAGFVAAAQNLAALLLDDPARPDDAIAVLKPAIARSPDGQLLQNLAYAYGLKGDLERAGATYEAALRQGEDARARFAWGSLLRDNKQPEKAAEQFKKALAATKDDADLLQALAVMLGETHAFGDCVTAFDRAFKLKGANAEGLTHRAACKHDLKDDAGAEQDYLEAIKANPKFAPAHYYLAILSLFQKNRLRGTVELEKAATLGAGTPLGKAARAKLDDLSKKK